MEENPCWEGGASGETCAFLLCCFNPTEFYICQDVEREKGMRLLGLPHLWYLMHL